MSVHSSVLQLLEMVEHFGAVERLDVPRLRRRETAHRPAQVHEVRLDRVRERVHADLLGETVALARVARAARRDDVRPVIRATARERHQVVARQRFTGLELREVTAAILAAIVIAREEERVRHLAAEAPRHVNELGKPDDGRPGQRQSL